MFLGYRHAGGFGCLLLMLVLVANTGPRSFASVQTTGHVGVSYLTPFHLYDTPTERLERDFAKFSADGIRTIAIVLMWYRLELSKGVYNQEFINNVIRVCNVADQYGLEVMIDFHTLPNDQDSWTNPAYVGVAMRLMTDPEIANAYVAMLSWAIRQLKDVKNIWAFSVLNEPWYWPLDEWRKTNWINLIIQATNTTRQITSKPVTVRFVSALFERDWNWDSRIINALDFISINAGVRPSETNDIYWNTFDEYRSGLLGFTQKAAALGKQVQITEFGWATYNDTLQAERYRSYTDIFDSTPNLIGWLSWCWDRGSDPNDVAYSLFGPISETARPAYLYLTGSIKTEVVVTQGEVKVGFNLTFLNSGTTDVNVTASASGSAAGWVDPKTVDFGTVALGEEKRIDNAFKLSVPETAASGNYTIDWTYKADTGQELLLRSYSIRVPGSTGTVTSTTATITVAPSPIPGFPIEAILIGLLSGLGALILMRRMRRVSSQ